MAPFRYFRRLAAGKAGVLALLCLFSAPSFSITAEEVMKKMSKDERFGYLTGLIDMLAYQMAASGDSKKAVCITDTYYRDGKEAAWKRFYEALEKHGDRRPEILLTVLVKQACGG